MPKTVWLVTHGETVVRSEKAGGGWIPDPSMSDAGFRAVTRLVPSISNALQGTRPPEIHCGTGRRQWEVVCALGLAEFGNIYFSSLWGDASTLANDRGERMALLGHGHLIPHDHYYTARHVGGKVIREVVASLPHNSLVCSGRPVLIRLGMKPEECESGALYSLGVQENGEIAIGVVTRGKVLTF